MSNKRKTPISDMEIGRRLADYPPEFLYLMGLIPSEESIRLLNQERYSKHRDRYRWVVACS